MKTTLVIGASTNPERYAYKAIQRLLAHGHKVRALALRSGQIENVVFETEQKVFDDVDTVSLYLGPRNQANYYNYVISLKPRRVIFNPGTENPEFFTLLEENNIEVEIACTLVLLATEQY